MIMIMIIYYLGLSVNTLLCDDFCVKIVASQKCPKYRKLLDFLLTRKMSISLDKQRISILENA